MVSAPQIDPRSRQEILTALKHYAAEYSSWRESDNLDMGSTLMTLVSHMVEDIQVRLNRVPDKNFLAFLNLIGVNAIPPQAAQVPLTFSLAEGSRQGTLIPAWTQVSAVTDDGEILFETTEDIYLNPTQMTGIYSREPYRDSYTNHTAAVLGEEPQVFSVFEGDTPIPHIFYIAHDELFILPENKRITLTFETMDASKLDALPIEWSYWNGEAWQTLDIDDALAAHFLWQITIEHCPVFQPITINDIEARWLRAELKLPLAPQQISDEEIMPLSEQVLELGNFEPFHKKRRFPLVMHLKTTDDEAEEITLEVKLGQAGTPTDKLVLAWEYWNGETWIEIGCSGTGLPEDADYPDFNDGTAALTQDGTVTFKLPDDWVQENDGGWIRILVKSGSYGRDDQAVYPEIESLLGHYVWMLRDLPYIERLMISAESVNTGLIPSRAYYDVQPLDLSADAFPFGTEPAFNSTFFITCEEAFSKPNAEVILNIGITNPVNATSSDPLPPVRPSANLVLAWEMWDGNTWREIGLSTPQNDSAGVSTYHFSDGTFCFLQDGRVRFVLPWGVQETELSNGDIGFWLRVRIVQGNYGLPEQYRRSGSTYELIAASFQPPAINRCTVDYRYLPEAPADTCLAYNDFHFQDVTEEAASESTLFQPFYRSQDVSPAVYICMESTSPESDLALHNAPVTFFLDVDSRFSRAELDTIATSINLDNPAQVVWEYWSKNGWQTLAVIDKSKRVTERGTVSFIGAADFIPSSEFDHWGYWIRMRWVQGRYKVSPRLRHLLLNTTWGLQGERVANQILGSSTGESHQIFFIESDEIILADQQIEIRRDDDWETWQEVTDFYSSHADDKHYTINRTTGEIRFGDGIYGAIPPSGANNIRASYRTGGSSKGNVPRHSIDQLKTTIPRLAGVINLVEAQGGDEQEALSRTKKRGPTLLRHRNRAVTADDYLDLAYEIAAVKRAIAITANQGASVGQVGLVIVPDSTASQPIPSLGLIEQVRQKLLFAAPPTIDLWVTGPDWVCASIIVEFVPQSFELAVATQYEMNRRLQAFLHPLTGYDGNGWAFGRLPQTSDIYALLEAMQGVDHIRYLDIQLTWDDEPRPNRFLVHSGTHEIIITGEDN